MILEPNSLMNTIDNVNDRFLYGQAIPVEEGLEVARWIVARQGERGAYRAGFAPTPFDFEQGIHCFTGEKLMSASARHILGQEAARAVWLLSGTDPALRAAYDQATAWMHMVEDFEQTGTFCCGRCTLAFWRHFWVGNFEDKATHVLNGLQRMKNMRSEDGKWQRFPFYYAIYTLLDLDLEAAVAELKYARPVMERLLTHPRTGAYSQRRSTILTQALEKAS